MQVVDEIRSRGGVGHPEARDVPGAARQNANRVLTVGELIALLRDADPLAPVVIAGREGGFDGVRAVARQPLRLNVNTLEGFGPHEAPAPGEQPDAFALAVVGPR